MGGSEYGVSGFTCHSLLLSFPSKLTLRPTGSKLITHYSLLITHYSSLTTHHSWPMTVDNLANIILPPYRNRTHAFPLTPQYVSKTTMFSKTLYPSHYFVEDSDLIYVN